MRKISLIIILMILFYSVHANNVNSTVPLDKIIFPLSAQQWLNTDTAVLSVNLNVTLNNSDIVQARKEIMANLSKICVGEWHIMQFKRSQDNSGLEKLFVQARIRAAQNNLNAVFQHAKAVSKPGATYEIANIEFIPSFEDIQKLKAKLREIIYQQAQYELNKINQIYSTQKYSLYSLKIIEHTPIAQPQALPLAAQNTMLMRASPSNDASSMAVGNKITLHAIIEAASDRK